MPKPAEKKPKPGAKQAQGKHVVKHVPERPEWIPGKNGGRLRNGGTNKGGTGRPASAIRERLRGSFDERVTILEDIADRGEQDSDRLKAIDLMAKYGLGKEVSVEDVKSRLAQTLDIIDEECDRERAEKIRERMRPVWR